MSKDLLDEVEAIRAIFGNDALREADDAFVYILSIPNREASLRIVFPPDYPESIPRLLGTEETGPNARKGFGNVLDTTRATLASVFIPGSVCLFDLLQELEVILTEESNDQEPWSSDSGADESLVPNAGPIDTCSLGEEPCWILSSTVTEKKSTFVARACTVTSVAQAQASVAHLDSDKLAAKASHHVSAYRIRAPSTEKRGEIVYQDFDDDDGENAAGGRLLHLLQLMNVWEVLVVVSRWYGGVKLGPNRFNIINNVAREAVVKGGWSTSGIKNH